MLTSLTPNLYYALAHCRTQITIITVHLNTKGTRECQPVTGERCSKSKVPQNLLPVRVEEVGNNDLDTEKENCGLVPLPGENIFLLFG
jgi:hypothetical protein